MPAFVLEVSCLTCPGVIDVVNPDRVRQAAVEHYQQLHPWVPTPAEGTDYVAIDAPKLCDTCLGLIELPYWEHISTPPTHAGGELDRDGAWLVCDTCHDLWAEQNLSGWVRRGLAVAVERSPWLLQASPDLRTGMRAELAGTLRNLIERFDAGRRVTLDR
jgi:hypothetical protein